MITLTYTNLIATIALARSDKRNAMTPAMIASLAKAIDQVTRDASLHHPKANALLLSGEGDTFCAGFDLTLCKDDPTALGSLLSGLSTCIRALRVCPLPVIISAHGAAIAGGCALLGGGDIVITNDTAKIGYPVVRLGISPAVSAPTLALATGTGPARTRLLDTALVSGIDAVRLGIAHESMPSKTTCEERALHIAKDLASKPRTALAATKRWLSEVDGSTNATTFETALNASLSLVNGPEERERLPQAWSKRS